MKRRYSINAPDQQRLKVARTEIEAVLKKHDLAGVVVLHTPGMTEFFYDIRPSYSCCWIAGQDFRIRSKLAEFDGDAEAQRHDQGATANMLAGLAQDLAQAGIMFLSVAQVADRAFDVTHTDAVLVPDPNEGKLQ